VGEKRSEKGEKVVRTKVDEGGKITIRLGFQVQPRCLPTRRIEEKERAAKKLPGEGIGGEDAAGGPFQGPKKLEIRL